MISLEKCKEVFEDELFAELISSYDIESFEEIKEIVVKVEHDGGGGIYSEQCDFHSYGLFTSLKGIENLTNLERLTIEYHEIQEVSLSEKFKLQLKSFCLHYFYADYELIEGMNNLEELCIGFENSHHLDKISKLPKLIKLHLYCRNILDFSDFSLLPKDCEASLTAINSIVDLEHIKTLGDLKYLDFSRCELLNSKIFEELSDLKSIRIYDCGDIDLEVIQSNKNLEDFIICKLKNKSKSLTLRDLPNLKSFSISGTNLKKLKLENLGKFRYINLSNNKFEEIVLRNVAGIRDLSASGNNFSTVGFLEEISDSIEEIDLDDNPIKDFSSLSGCHNLKSISINNTQIISLKHFFGLKKVQIYLNNNENIDVEELQYLVEKNNCEISCDIKYLQILDPLRSIKDSVLKSKLEKYIYDLYEYENKEYFCYKPLLEVKDLNNFSHDTMDVPTRIESSCCFPGDINTLEGIEVLENLELFSLDLNFNRISLKPLSKLKKLKGIGLTQAIIYDIESLLELENLEAITLLDSGAHEGYEKDFKSLEESGVKVHCSKMWWRGLFDGMNIGS